MTTRKELIIDKYCKLKNKLLEYLDKNIFPNLDEFDISDVVFLLTYQFLNINTDDEYSIKIKEIILCHELTVKESDLVVILPLIIEFIKWIKQL